jgi:HAD superfamily hydrolase (TIGR01549 family)
MLTIERIQAVLFDIDGTLSDTDDAYLDRLLRFTRPFQALFGGRNPRRVYRRWMMASEDIASLLFTVPDRLGIDPYLDRCINWLSRLRGISQPDWFRLIDGVGPMLENLSRRYPLAIVTSRNQRSTDAFLAQFGLTPCFRTVITAFSTPRIKPHPAPILAAAGALGVPPVGCLMVGDTSVDILSGRRAGAQTAGVLCGFSQRADLEKAGADAILETTADLIGLLG